MCIARTPNDMQYGVLIEHGLFHDSLLVGVLIAFAGVGFWVGGVVIAEYLRRHYVGDD